MHNSMFTMSACIRPRRITLRHFPLEASNTRMTDPLTDAEASSSPFEERHMAEMAVSCAWKEKSLFPSYTLTLLSRFYNDSNVALLLSKETENGTAVAQLHTGKS